MGQELDLSHNYLFSNNLGQITGLKRNIRIKDYLHILQKDGTINFIKTLDEGVQLPSGDFSDTLMECLTEPPTEEIFLQHIIKKLNTSVNSAKLLLNKLLEMGIIEYYSLEIPAKTQRYHRQLLLFDSIIPKSEFSENYITQEKLQKTHVLIIGIGGIGNFMATSLVMAGVGKITLVDFDIVEETNFNRQVLFSESNIGESKVLVAAKRLQELNSQCEINALNMEIHSNEEFEKLLNECGAPSYVVLSADKPVDLVLWASALCKKYHFKYVKCGYMAYQGLIGPLLGYDTKAYDEIFQSWATDIRSQNEQIKSQNEKHIAPSMAATNAILANIAAWELIKDMTGISKSVLVEKRLLFNLKTMEMVYG